MLQHQSGGTIHPSSPAVLHHDATRRLSDQSRPLDAASNRQRLPIEQGNALPAHVAQMHLYALGHYIPRRLLGSGVKTWRLKLLRGSHLHIEHLHQQQLLRTDAVAKALLMPLLECRHQRRRPHLLAERQHQGLLGTGIAQLQRQPNHRLILETL